MASYPHNNLDTKIRNGKHVSVVKTFKLQVSWSCFTVCLDSLDTSDAENDAVYRFYKKEKDKLIVSDNGSENVHVGSPVCQTVTPRGTLQC